MTLDPNQVAAFAKTVSTTLSSDPTVADPNATIAAKGAAVAAALASTPDKAATARQLRARAGMLGSDPTTAKILSVAADALEQVSAANPVLVEVGNALLGLQSEATAAQAPQVKS